MLFLLFINFVIDPYSLDLMLPFLLLPLSAIFLLCLILLLCGKASKKREDMSSIHEGITARLFTLLFYPNSWCLTLSMRHCLSLSLAACQVTCFLQIYVLCQLSLLSAILSIWVCLHTSLCFCLIFPPRCLLCFTSVLYFSSLLHCFTLSFALVGFFHNVWIIAFPRSLLHFSVSQECDQSDSVLYCHLFKRYNP